MAQYVDTNRWWKRRSRSQEGARELPDVDLDSIGPKCSGIGCSRRQSLRESTGGTKEIIEEVAKGVSQQAISGASAGAWR